MRRSPYLTGIGFVLTFLVISCVDAYEPVFNATVNVIVVDGTITNLAEPQVIRLNRSKADPITGRFGTTPITKAMVEVVVDSAQVIAAHETVDGTYRLPNDFRGQIGHAYQLRFALSDGVRYESSQQVMPAGPPIDKANAQFNPNSLSPTLLGGYTAAHDLFIDTQDPIITKNYYRWEWKLYEKQLWCRTCVKGVYSVNNIRPKVYYLRDYFVAGTDLYENCFTPPAGQADFEAPLVPDGHWFYDYTCRTQCWEQLYSYDINIFADTYTNGGRIAGYRVAQIPYYTNNPCLVDVRQLSLTADAYTYYKLFQDQTIKTGGVADTPPAAPVGNVHRTGDSREAVVGYFTASAVSQVHHWLDRKDTQGLSLGASKANGQPLTDGEELFYVLNDRAINREPPPPYQGGRDVPNIRILGGAPRPPSALCLPSDSRTPFKPEGWRD